MDFDHNKCILSLFYIMAENSSLDLYALKQNQVAWSENNNTVEPAEKATSDIRQPIL